jgi:hypothetical protein
MEILLVVVAFVVVGIAAQVFGVDTRPVEKPPRSR